MKIGLIGLPQTGKKTLFTVLTNSKISENDLSSDKNIKGITQIKDPRFDKLVSMYNPKKQMRARIDIELLSKIEKDAIVKGDIFKDIAEFDAVCHVVRAFEDESIYHQEGSVNAKRDIDSINAELILNDMLFIEKRLEKIENNLKKTNVESALKEKELLIKLKEQLEKDLPLRLLDLSSIEKKIISSYPFITLKKMMIALNVQEGKIKDGSLLDGIQKQLEELGIYITQVCAKVESEIAELDSEEEKKEFLNSLGVNEPAVDALTRICLKALNLISFFTVGADEVRHWTVKKGSTAPEAAGQVHTDLEKGFIRAEVMKCADLLFLGSETKVKESGKWYLKGKDYIVEDGDILSIRFNV